MPNYRVGVSLNLRGNYGSGLTGASRQTDRFRGALQRTAAGATSAMRRTAAAAGGVGDALGRTARGGSAAMRRVAGAARIASGALNRTTEAARRVGTTARRMADTASQALDRARSKVNRLIGRFRVLERTGRNAGGGLGSSLGRLAGYAGGGFAVARGAQTAASMDTLVRRLSRESKRPMEELTGLRDRAYEIGADRGVHATELMQAVQAAQAAGGVRIESGDLESLAVIMQRAGVGGVEAGNIWARIDELPGETRENVATLAMQADAGELQFRDVIGQITRLVSSVRSWATDETAVAQMGAMMNVARAGSGSIDEASAAMDTLTREAVMRAEKIREVFGVDVLSAAPGREGFLREDFFSGAIMEIADSARAWGGEARLLEAFGADALRAIKSLLTQEGRDKGQESLAIRGEWSPFVADADVVAEGIEARGIAMMQKLEGALTRTITGPMQGAFTLMQAYQTELMVGTAGVLAAFNVFSRLRLNRTLAAGARNQTVATSTVATMRVGTLIVGSMPGGGGRPGGGRGPGGPGGVVLGPDGKPARQQPGGGGTTNRTAGRPGRVAGWFRALRGGRGIPYAGAAVAGLTLLPAVASGDTRSVVQSTAGLAGGWGGAVAGMKAGALLGAFVGPVGAAIGSAIGGLLGGGAGWWAGERAATGLLDRDEADEGERTPPQHPRLRRRPRADLAGRTAGVEREPEEEPAPSGDEADEGERTPPQHPRLRRRPRADLAGRTAGVEREPEEEPAPSGDEADEGERTPPQHPRLRRRPRADLAGRTAGVEREPEEEPAPSGDEADEGERTPPQHPRLRRRPRADLAGRTAGVEREPEEEPAPSGDEADEGERTPPQHPRLRRRPRADLAGRTAGVEREPEEEPAPSGDEADEGERTPPQHPRLRRRPRADLAGRTAGVEREPEEEPAPSGDEADEGERTPPQHPRLRRRPRAELDGTVRELRPAPRSVTYDHSDHSDRSVHIAPGAITVQAADDPEATAEAVADRVMEITERERQRRGRRIRDTVLEDPEPDPEF